MEKISNGQENGNNGALDTSSLTEMPSFEEHMQKNSTKNGEKANFARIEDLNSLYDFENSAIFGHGTASAGNGHEVIESIFEEGVKGFESLGNMVGEDRDDEISGSTDISDNTVGLWSSDEGELEPAKLRNHLDHWEHRNAKNIILLRFPLAYFNMSEISSERAKAFFTVHEDKNGHLCNYIDRRFIIGNYSTDTGLIELNEHFEPEINGDFKVELDERLKRAKDETKERHEEFGKLYARHNNGAPEAEGESADDMEEWSDEGWD